MYVPSMVLGANNKEKTMKRIMIAGVAVAISAFAQAATVDWGYVGQSSEVGYSVYLYATAVEAKYTSFEALIADSFASGTVETKRVGPNTTYKIANTSAAANELGDVLYYVLVSGSDASTYTYGSSNISALKYDPGNMETSPGALGLTSSNFSSSGTIGSIPEPTSGLLLLLGVAGLALKRKRI